MTPCSTCLGMGKVIEAFHGRTVECPTCKGKGTRRKAKVTPNTRDDQLHLPTLYEPVEPEAK